MDTLIGYQLVDGSGAVLQSWGNVWGQVPAIPDMIQLPNGDQVHCPALATAYEGCQLVEWNGTPPLPDLLPYQFKAILVLSGQATALEMFFNGLPTQNKVVAQAKLDYALSFQRHDPLLLAAQSALGLTDAQLDALWVQASQL